MAVKPIEKTQQAEIAGVSFRQYYRLFESDDPPPANGDCKEFGEWLKRRILKGVGVTPEGQIYDYATEKARLTKAQADKTELEVEVMRGTLFPAEMVESVWSNMILAFRAKIMAVPTRAAPETALAVASARPVAEVEELLSGFVREALDELSEYSPEHYAGNGKEGGAESQVSAETDSKPVGRRRKKAEPGKRGGTRSVANQ